MVKKIGFVTHKKSSTEIKNSFEYIRSSHDVLWNHYAFHECINTFRIIYFKEEWMNFIGKG